MSVSKITKSLLFCIFLFQISTAWGAIGCPDTKLSRVWSADCFDMKHGVMTVKKQFKKNLVFNGRSYTTIVVDEPPQFVSISRSGKVHPDRRNDDSEFSFEPTDGRGGRFGFLSTGADKKTVSKCGYYKGGYSQVIVPPIYDQCDPFIDGQALVCVGCTSSCETGDCHDSDFVGGKGYIINEQNEVLEEVELPALPLCSRKVGPIRAGINCRVPLEH